MGTIVVRRSSGLVLDAPAGSLLASYGGSGGGEAMDAIAAAEISVEDLSDHEKEELEASDEYITADAMPLSLIEPMADPAQPAPADAPDEDSETVDEDGKRIAWGIVATGADKSDFDGSGVPVAVLDTGIDKNHPAFAGVNIVAKNFTNGQPDEDVHGHGTHCAGTIFGRDVDGTRIGVARGVTQAFIGKVIPGGSDALVDALNWAFKSGVRIASMSLAFDFYKMMETLKLQGLPAPAAMSTALRNFRANITTIDLLINQFRARSLDGNGMVVVAATGNESKRDLNAPAKPYVIAASTPASSMGIIAVGALRRRNAGHEVAGFSNTSPQVSAPGVNILSAMANTPGLIGMHGTSMATPHVAGLAALYWQEALDEGGATAETIAARIVGRADKARLAQGSKRIDIGAGMPHAP